MSVDALAEVLYEAWREAADRVDPNVRRGDTERTTIYAPRMSWRSLNSTQRMIWVAVARRAEGSLLGPIEHYAANPDGTWHKASLVTATEDDDGAE